MREENIILINKNNNKNYFSYNVNRKELTIFLNDYTTYRFDSPINKKDSNIPLSIIVYRALFKGLLSEKPKEKVIDLYSSWSGIEEEKNKSTVFPFDKFKYISESTYQVSVGPFIGKYIYVLKKGEYEGYRLIFDIQPRFGNQILGYMLQYCLKNMVSQKSIEERVRQGHIKSSFWLALFWLIEFYAVHRSGIPKLYVRKTDDLPYLKGRLLIRRQITNQIQGRCYNLIPCQYRELSYNNIINRTIRFCYQRIRAIIQGRGWHEFLAPLQRMDKILASYGVGKNKINPGDLDRIHYTSLAEGYRDLMQRSKALLQMEPEKQGEGSARKSHPYLIDVTQVWEKYIESILAQSLKYQYKVWSANDNKDQQKRLLHDEASNKLFNRKPDIIIEKKEKAVAIVDAKFRITNDEKGVNNYNIENDDVDQLVTYMARYSFNNPDFKGGALVYPEDILFAYCPLKIKDSQNQENESKLLQIKRWDADKEWVFGEKSTENKGFIMPWRVGLLRLALPCYFAYFKIEQNEDTESKTKNNWRFAQAKDFNENDFYYNRWPCIIIHKNNDTEILSFKRCEIDKCNVEVDIDTPEPSEIWLDISSVLLKTDTDSGFQIPKSYVRNGFQKSIKHSEKEFIEKIKIILERSEVKH